MNSVESTMTDIWSYDLEARLSPYRPPLLHELIRGRIQKEISGDLQGVEFKTQSGGR